MATASTFRLTRYFTLTSLAAFAIVGVSLYFLERAEQVFLERVQAEQAAFFAQAQSEFMTQQHAAARANLLTEHEVGHVTLARLFANALWAQQFAPLVASVEALPVDECRALAPAARARCFAELGKRIQALPGFSRVNDTVHAMMRKSSVFKIKVYDMRGLTVYSSELAQVGEDKADNIGWATAARGKPATELVHRDRFSAFEGVVENRDLIQSYVPVLSAEGDRVHGVFEIYSDVTALLAQIDSFTARFAKLAATNQAKLEDASRTNQAKVASSSRMHFAILGLLFVLLYLALLVSVRNAQRILDDQGRERREAALREQAWHREKMAALATMAANAAHEIGNPLAVITSLADDIASSQDPGDPCGDKARTILEQSARIAQMNRRITEFASARSESAEPIDVNQMVKAMCDFFAFDSRYRGARIDMRLGERIPACLGVPDHLNEALMTLLQAHGDASLAAKPNGGRLFVQTETRGGEVVILIGASELSASDPRVESAKRRVESMGGRLVTAGPTSEIHVPCAPGP